MKTSQSIARACEQCAYGTINHRDDNITSMRNINDTSAVSKHDNNGNKTTDNDNNHRISQMQSSSSNNNQSAPAGSSNSDNDELVISNVSNNASINADGMKADSDAINDAEKAMNKRTHGQWFTDGNPFYTDVFMEWFTDAYNALKEEKHTVKETYDDHILMCEPYAGALGLIRHLNDTLIAHNHAYMINDSSWSAFDIQPVPDDKRLVSDVSIMQADTLLSIPGDYDMIITNPPYLGRSSASRRHIPFNDGGNHDYTDLYQVALNTCLNHAGYIAAIVPESIITSSFSKQRCSHIISLKAGLFTDTDCPVALVLFNPDEDMFGNTDGRMTMIHDNTGALIGSLSELESISDESLRINRNVSMTNNNTMAADADSKKPTGLFNQVAMINDVNHGTSAGFNLVFNDKHGDVGLHGVDSGREADIRFVRGNDDDISPDSIKVSSRSITRISRSDGLMITDNQIQEANRILNEWRMRTNDVFMTAFKGVRKDGKYRRRLDYNNASRILMKAIIENN